MSTALIKGHRITSLVRSTLTELGQGATYQQTLELLKQHGVCCTEGTYEKHYRSLFVESPPSPLAISRNVNESKDVPVISVAPLAVSRNDVEKHLDGLSVFIRFAVAVEQAGGPARARQLLDLLEKVRGIVDAG